MVSFRQVKEFKHRINPTEEVEGRGNFGYYIVRPVSMYFTWLVLQTGLSANNVTVLHLILGVVGSGLLAHPDVPVRVAGGLLLYLGFVLDNVDGEVARFRKQVSITGKYLDTVAHTIVNTLMFIGFGFGAFLDTGRVEFALLGFLAGLFSIRLDVFVMYTTAAHSAKANLDKAYDYYARLEEKASAGPLPSMEHVSKKAASPMTRLAFAVFAYPGFLHIMTISLIVHLLFPNLLSLTIPAIVIAGYGLLLPVRRMLTIRRIVINLETEREVGALKQAGTNEEERGV